MPARWPAAPPRSPTATASTGLNSPTERSGVTALLRHARRTATPRRPPRRRPAQLARMAAACPRDLAGLRDRALLLLAANRCPAEAEPGRGQHRPRAALPASGWSASPSSSCASPRAGWTCGCLTPTGPARHRACVTRAARCGIRALPGAGAAGLAAGLGHAVRAGVPQGRPLGQCRASPPRRRCGPPHPGAPHARAACAGTRPHRDTPRQPRAKIPAAADRHAEAAANRALAGCRTNRPATRRATIRRGSADRGCPGRPQAADAPTPRAEPDPPPRGPPRRRRTIAADPATRRDSRRPVLRPTAPLRLAHTDWLYHRLTISGPPEPVAAFRAAAAGRRGDPLAARPRSPRRRFLPPAGRAAGAAAAHASAWPAPASSPASCATPSAAATISPWRGSAAAGPARSTCTPWCRCRAALLRLGPDDPAALAWLWTHWGTTQALRHVTA